MLAFIASALAVLAVSSSALAAVAVSKSALARTGVGAQQAGEAAVEPAATEGASLAGSEFWSGERFASSGLFDPSLTATSTCTPEWGSFAVGNWPPACWHPYGPTSPFNFRIPASAKLSSESTAIIRYMIGHHWSFNSNEAGDFAFGEDGSRPVYWSKRTDPLIKVKCGGVFSCQPGMKVHIPQGARPQTEWDHHMTIVEQSSGIEYDFWRASMPEHLEMTVEAGNGIPIGAKSGTGLGAYAEAANLGLLGGIIRASELKAGKIGHALVTSVKCEQRHDVWPAPETGEADVVCPYELPGPHLGSLLQLNMSEAEIAATGAPSWQRTIMNAMALYGMYVVDSNGKWDKHLHFMKEDDISYTSFRYPGAMTAFVSSAGGVEGTLVGVPIPMSRLRVIDSCVPRGTC